MTLTDAVVLEVEQFAKLKSSIHESTYRLFKHMTQMDMRIDNAMKEFELRKRAMIKARESMQSISVNTSKIGDELPIKLEVQPLPVPDDEAGDREPMPSINRHLRTWSVPRWVMPRHAVALTLFALTVPVAAMDQQLVLGNVPFTMPGTMDPHQVPAMAIWTCTGMLFLWGSVFMDAARSLIGPGMGITSVLYFMMRNDEAVKPSFAWGYVFIWNQLLEADILQSPQCLVSPCIDVPHCPMPESDI